MFDLEIYCCQGVGKTVRLSHAMSFAGGERRAPDASFARELSLPKTGKTAAVKASFDAALEHVAEIQDLGFVVVMDAASLRVVQGWSAAELGILVHMATQDIDGMDILAAAEQAGVQFFPIDAAFGHLTGILRANGSCEALRIKRVGPERRSNVAKDNKGWRMIAIEVSSELKEQASEAMMSYRPDDEFEDMKALTDLFWRDVAGQAKDPLVRQEPLVLMLNSECNDPDCDCKTHSVTWLQPAPKLSFRAGSEDELMGLLKSYFELALNGPKAEALRNRLDVTDGDIVVMFQAAFDSLDPCLMMVNDWGAESLHHYRLLDVIIRTMRPAGSSLRGGPRLSQSKDGPATISCLLTRLDFGATRTTPVQAASGHELLAHSTRLIDWLIARGASEAYAQSLVAEI